MNARFLLSLLVTCLFALGAAAQPAPSRSMTTADPNDPDKTRTIVSREERERLGLTLRTWTGVVHPDVSPRWSG